MINLNDSAYNGSSNVQIFNDGKAGIARNVIGSKIESKQDTGNGPDYKLFFKDSNGAEVNMAFWYLDTTKDTFAKDLEKQGKVLKHLIHCYLGADYQIPAFASVKDLLDGCIKLIAPKFTTVLVRVYCTYGSTMAPKKYIQIRSYVPFIENEIIPVGDTRLRASQIDQMTRLEEDKPMVTASAAASDVI